jgi:energy-coupling factor transport system ATP-binding protein
MGFQRREIGGFGLPIIEIKDLHFTYAGKRESALKGINLNIEEGEFVLVAGRSGSGKSTLLKCINGLIPHRYMGRYSGEVRVKGLRVAETKLSQLSQVVGTVMQEVSKQLVLPIVSDDVAFGLCNQCLSLEEVKRRVELTLARMGISHLRDRDINELSGGEKQRVAIAGVLAMDPPVILMDEPLANLDSEGVSLLQQLIRQLKGEGRTLIVAEHRVEEVLEAGVDRVVVMEQGEIVEDTRDPRALAKFVGRLKLPAEMLVRSIKAEPTAPGGGATTPAGRAAVEFRDVWFSYDGKPVLLGVNLVIREGERVALLGNNGAGKSTMAKLMLGILKPTRGDVLVYGVSTTNREVYELAPIVGLVFQDPFAMLFAKTVKEEISFGPLNTGVPRDEIPSRVVEAAEICRVKHLLDHSPFASSHGEKKRICVASILSMRPKVLVLDEPTAGQDYESYTSFMEFVDELIRKDVVKTLVLITHDTDLAIEYTDRTLVLSNGKVIADGPTRRLLADPEVLRRGKIRETSLIRTGRALTGGFEVIRLRELQGSNSKT